MSVFFYIFLAGSTLVIGFLILMLISQLRGSRHRDVMYRYTDTLQTAESSQPHTVQSDPADTALSPRAIPETSPEIPQEMEAVTEAVEAVPEPEPDLEPEFELELELELEPEPEPELVPALEPEKEIIPEATEIVYPEFDHSRSMEQLGLTEQEAVLFIDELAQQINDEMPKLEAALLTNDMEALEESSHLLKGSAANLGEGGITDALTDFNDACKAGEDATRLSARFAKVKEELYSLSRQYGIEFKS